MEEVYLTLASPIMGIVVFLVIAIGCSILYANEVKKHLH